MTETLEVAALTSLEDEIIGLRRMHADRKHAEVLRRLAELLIAYPENRDLLILAAANHRHLRQIDEAMALLDQLEILHPGYSQLYQERGLCQIQLKNADAAIQALLTAVHINPALVQSWSILEGLYRMKGDLGNARMSAAHVTKLKDLPADIVKATSLFSDGDLAPAEHMMRRFLLEKGDHPEAMRLLARIGLAHDVLNDAEVLLKAVLDLTPDYTAARFDFAQTLVKRQKYQAALSEINVLLEAAPSHVDYLTLAATAYVGLGQNERAIELYDAMMADLPQSWDPPLWRGHALKTIGRVPEAVLSYQRAAKNRLDFGDAYWSLANLKTYRFSDEEISEMLGQEALATTRLLDRYHLCFALGKAFEDRGETAMAWSFYEKGNGLKRSESHYRPEIIETNTNEQKRICTSAFFDSRRSWGVEQTDPIFVLGLPRSGSTLCEQILASHSKVEGTQELSNIQRIVLDLQGPEQDLENPRYPSSLCDLSASQVSEIAQAYLHETQIYRSGKPYFIDKMPNNFRHIGLIHLMFPKARIIDTRRDPMSCCFSNLKQLFAQGQEFTYSVEDIARYYRTYLDLMEHWDRVLPGRIFRLHHEDVVDDLDMTVRRLLDYCELDFEPGCIAFHATKRSVRTPSSEQVRQPIFRDGLEQWRRFETWLEPLRLALGDALVRYRH